MTLTARMSLKTTILYSTPINDLDDLRQHIRGKIEEINNAVLYFVVNFAASL
jgi:hypothetical protein